MRGMYKFNFWTLHNDIAPRLRSQVLNDWATSNESKIYRNEIQKKIYTWLSNCSWIKKLPINGEDLAKSDTYAPNYRIGRSIFLENHQINMLTIAPN